MRFRNRRGHRRRELRPDTDGAVSLTSLCEGEKAVITNACGGFGLVRRLAEMGLTPGVELKLLRKCPFQGPIEIEVRGVALALGHGIASRVFVKLSGTESNG